MKHAWPVFLWFAFCGTLFAQTPASAPTNESIFLTIEGDVQIYPVGGTGWVAAKTNQIVHLGDRLRTSERSRATIRLSDLTILRLNELTAMTLRPSETTGEKSLIDMKSGSAYFLGREKPPKQEFRTPLTSGAIRGTEFNLAVAENGSTTVTLIEGEVGLSNELGHLDMSSGYQGVVNPGAAPFKTPMLDAVNIIQWCLYYPGVLDPDELQLSDTDRQALGASLSAYRSGDLLAAVAQYPAAHDRVSPAELVYRAAILLSAGQAEQAGSLLTQVEKNKTQDTPAFRLAGALLEMIAVVKNQAVTNELKPALASEWLVQSYYLQAHSRLPEALDAARAAVAKSPNFGFGWARVAELEMSVGHLSAALAAVEKSLQLSPRNAQSLAVKGFIELAQGHVGAASSSFDQAIAIDGALGNGWLGRGLCKIRRGHADAGMKDIQAAVIMEPQRAVLRSYLGKAFSNDGDNGRAKKELALSGRLDPNDPTSWLYKALVEQQENEINPAVRDLEQSAKLNDNQSLFRSKLLLDEDQAVRSANLARIYQDTGFYNLNTTVAQSDWGTREAARSVTYDYGNYSAHQFLADSYDGLRDPNQINLRYETPWFDELIMANLLSPVAAGNLSEYSSLRQTSDMFEKNHFGGISDTEYLSRGDWLQRSSVYGTYDFATFSIDNEYRSSDGWRANNRLQADSTTAKVKFQLTPQDSLLIEGIYSESSFGDTAQYYNQYGAISGVTPVPSSKFTANEHETPDLFVGYHHEWGPGSHTLFLGGYLTDHLQYNDPLGNSLFTANSFGNLLVTNYDFPVNYDRQFQAYSAELQQILQTEHQTMVAGVRYQLGWTTTSATEVDNQFNTPPLAFNQPNVDNTLERYTAYGYETVKPFDFLQLTAGITYDHLRFPQNDEVAPISTQESSVDQVSPKAGFVWTLAPKTFFRFAYTRSLGGLSYDNSVRLEPTQVAGFNQAFRSIIPESVSGIVPGSHFTTYAVGLDHAFKSSTYLSIDGQILQSDASRSVGTLTNTGLIFPVPRGVNNVPEYLRFTEQTLTASVTQLLGDNVSMGARYELSHAGIDSQFTGLLPNQHNGATFQEVILHLNYVHPLGFFAQAQGIWIGQANYGYNPGLDSTDFWQANLYAGYRFLHRKAEARIGLLNITDQNYLLNPLNLFNDLPRERTLSASFKFYF